MTKVYEMQRRRPVGGSTVIRVKILAAVLLLMFATGCGGGDGQEGAKANSARCQRLINDWAAVAGTVMVGTPEWVTARPAVTKLDGATKRLQDNKCSGAMAAAAVKADESAADYLNAQIECEDAKGPGPECSWRDKWREAIEPVIGPGQ